MNAIIKGQFLENGSYHSSKTNTDVYYVILLCGSQAVQVNGVQCPESTKRLDNVEMCVDIRAYNSQLICSYVKS